MRTHTIRWAAIALAAVATLAAPRPAGAQSVEKPAVSLMLDWTIAGTHAPFFIPLDKGYYRAEGLTSVKIDRGTGAGNTANNVASGVYDFGWADVTTLVAFDAQNQGKELTLVYVSFQDAPLAVVSLKPNEIRSLKDLAGKTVADQYGSAAGAVINFVTKAGTPDEIKITRKFVSPQLREPMLIKREVDAILAFDVSSIMTLVDLGVPRDRISVLRYADIGFDVYGTGLWVRRDFMEKNPRTVAAMVRAVNRGTKDAIANPAAAAEMMTKYAPLLKPNIECQRLLIALEHHLNADVAKHGLSYVDPRRMQRTIEQVVRVQKFDRTPALDHVWTDRFLPPEAERIPPPLGTCEAK
jgi:NitT/TauT family transport system substrate-binding protein